MIVMKFGGTSVADAERMRDVVEIVRSRRAAAPVVVLSALAGVTDLLQLAADRALADDPDGVERALSDLSRRHRWAVEAVDDAGLRHDLTLDLDRRFDELRQLLRSLRTLGEATPRATDTLLAFGELASTRIADAVFTSSGLDTRWLDPRRLVATDGRHGAARPDLEAMAARCREQVLPVIEQGRIPLIGGFVGHAPSGATTTLGRGGSDTSAAALASALGADEIQIWTDVDGLMTADPGIVPAARTLPVVSFAEAAELAAFGARVLHPESIAPAVRRAIPVRVLNSRRPEGEGTLILVERTRPAVGLAAVAYRGGLTLVRARERSLSCGRAVAERLLGALGATGLRRHLVVSGDLGAAVVVDADVDAERVRESCDSGIELEWVSRRAVICVVGSALRDGARLREVLAALAGWSPDAVAVGGSAHSVSAVISEPQAHEAVRELHRRFWEQP